MDAHDLFKKLCKGVKLNNKNRSVRNPSFTKLLPGKSAECDIGNTAEEWLNSKITIKSEEDSSLNHNADNDTGAQTEDISSNVNTIKSKESSEIPFSLFFPKTTEEGVTIDPSSEKKKAHKQKLTPEEKIKAQEEERINILRKNLRLSVSGGGVPTPVVSFNELQEKFGVSSTLVSNLFKSGYSEPTPIQAQAWPIMLEKRQILACAPTGSGKTAAFLIPLLHHLRGLRRDGVRAVIVSPTRELAQQTYRECMRLAEGTGLNINIISKINTSSSKLNIEHTRKYDILLTTPNRLVFLLKQEPPVLSLHNVEWLVVDESDKLFESGPRGFRDQLAVIYQACDSGNVKRAMFSATHGVHVARWCRENLKGVIAVTVGHRNTTADKVDQELVFVGNEQGKLLAMRDMITKGLQPPVLIFVQSKERAKELFSELLYDGINVDVIHADRTQVQRDNVVRSFREGKIWVLICTELMGRGIDFKGVNLVINYDFPPSAISYIHRIGRTGRAGRAGRAVTFFTEADSTLLRSIATVMKDSGCEVPDYMLDLKKVTKTARKKLENSAPERERISTAPLSEIRKKEIIRRNIENEKRKKRGLPPLPERPLKRKLQNNTDKGNGAQPNKKKKRKTNDTNKLNEGENLSHIKGNSKLKVKRTAKLGSEETNSIQKAQSKKDDKKRRKKKNVVNNRIESTV